MISIESKYFIYFLMGVIVGLLSFGIYHGFVLGNQTDYHTSNLGKSDTSYDLRFIKAMTSHHLGAIEMGKVAVEKSKNEKVKAISQNIIDSQTLEIALMSQWKKDWYNNAEEVKLTEYSLIRNLGNYDEKFDLRYLNAMIVHHEGALDMCKDALTKSTRNQILTICNDILSSQSQEISQMESIREELYKIKK